jgi:bifunctional non-homologous end joining protein LigD
MHVEDHPLEYEKFEGTIAPGNYGAGTVMVRDFGFYGDISAKEAAQLYRRHWERPNVSGCALKGPPFA